MEMDGNAWTEKKSNKEVLREAGVGLQ